MQQAASKQKASAPSVDAARPAFGRPRSPAAHQAMLDAACDIFAAGGLGALNVQAICERAGCSRATFYRRWSTVWECYAEAIDRMIGSSLVLDASGDVLDGLAGMVLNLHQMLSDPVYKSNFGMYLVEVGEPSEHSFNLRKGMVDRRNKLRDRIEQAASEGRVQLLITPDALLNVANGLALDAALFERKLSLEDVETVLGRLIKRT